MKKHILQLFLFFFLLFSGYAQVTDNTFSVNIDSTKWEISNYLVGMHSAYSNEPDAFYENDAYGYIAWMNTAEINTMRYPGGSIVKYWDWENPSGISTGDPWNPTWDSSNQVSESEWLGLDEYLDIVDATGMVPLLGVNINSGYDFDKEQESIDRAVRMVNYVKNRGHGGAFWYLGNEGGNDGLTNEARLFKNHAMAMKAADPNIKTMFNHNNLTPSYLSDYLAIAGDYIDIAETHGKWPYGGSPNLAPGTFAEWQIECPLQDRKNGQREWRNTLQPLKQAAIDAGYPNLLFANNEYGLGKNSNLLGFNKFSKSMVAIDLLQEHFIGNWFMSCYWSSIRNTDKADGGVVDASNNYNFNPMSIGFEMLAKAQGGNMLEMTDDAGHVSVYGFAAEKDDDYLVYLINKSDTNQNTTINFQSTNLIAPEFLQGIVLVDTPDHFGNLIPINATNQGSNTFTCNLPSISYSRFTFKKKSLNVEDLTLKTDWNLNVYPNPIIEHVKVTVDSGVSIKEFAVFDIEGRKVTSGKLDNSNTINFGSLSNGLYLLKLIRLDGAYKFVKVVKDGY